MDYLQRHRFMDMKTNQVAAKLKDMGAEHIFLTSEAEVLTLGRYLRL